VTVAVAVTPVPLSVPPSRTVEGIAVDVLYTAILIQNLQYVSSAFDLDIEHLAPGARRLHHGAERNDLAIAPGLQRPVLVEAVTEPVIVARGGLSGQNQQNT
jgi:hypothetical protein